MRRSRGALEQCTTCKRDIGTGNCGGAPTLPLHSPVAQSVAHKFSSPTDCWAFRDPESRRRRLSQVPKLVHDMVDEARIHAISTNNVWWGFEASTKNVTSSPVTCSSICASNALLPVQPNARMATKKTADQCVACKRDLGSGNCGGESAPLPFPRPSNNLSHAHFHTSTPPTACWAFRDPEPKKRRLLDRAISPPPVDLLTNSSAAVYLTLSAAAVSLTEAAAVSANQFMEHIEESFTIVPIPMDGDCTFSVFAAIASRITSRHISAKEMRRFIGDHVLQIRGKIKLHDPSTGDLISCDAYNCLNEAQEVIPDTMRFEIMRGKPEIRVTVQQFRDSLIKGYKKSKIYGGDECFAAFVDLYQVSVARYSFHTTMPETFNIARPCSIADYHILYRCERLRVCEFLFDCDSSQAGREKVPQKITMIF